jgi:hypothetical protein
MNRGPDSEGADHDQRPYWKRAHRDWRLWVVVLLMLTATMIYVLSENLSWRPRGQPQPQPAGAVGK